MAERVWDRFLTEQDKAHLALRAHQSRGFGTSPVLLLIDLYRGVYGDRPEPLLEAVKTWLGSCGLAAWNAVPFIQELLKTARAAGVPIIHTTGLDDAAGPGWGGQRAAKMDPEAMARDRRKYQIIDQVAPVPGEIVVRKASPSGFWGTPLAGYLTALGVDTVITCGESTSGCVRASVVDGCTYRYRMIVVEECVFDRHEACHAINLFDMNQKYADVLPLAEVLRYLRSWHAQRVSAGLGAADAPVRGLPEAVGALG